MSFHQLEFQPGSNKYADPQKLPHTLPVMYENKRIALAVFDRGKYRFNLPEEIGFQIDFGKLRPSFIFGRTGQGWSRVLDGEDDVLFIVLEEF